MKTLDTIAADMKYLTQSHEEFRQEAKAELKEIRIQTQKTNGKVMKAEQDILDLKAYHVAQEKKYDSRIDRYIAPVVTGIAIGGILLFARYVLGL